MARLSSGASEERLNSANFCGTSLGSNSGIDAITRTRPVWGSMATIDPLRPPRAWMATFWAWGSSVVITSLPSRLRSCSWLKIVPNSLSWPVRSALCERSTPARPREMNE